MSLVIANHGTTSANTTVELNGGGSHQSAAPPACSVAKVDSSHSNAYTAWIAMGKPQAPSGTMDPKTLATLHAASEMHYVPVACVPCSSSSKDTSPASDGNGSGGVGGEGGAPSLCVTVHVEPTSVASIRITFS